MSNNKDVLYGVGSSDLHKNTVPSTKQSEENTTNKGNDQPLKSDQPSWSCYFCSNSVSSYWYIVKKSDIDSMNIKAKGVICDRCVKTATISSNIILLDKDLKPFNPNPFTLPIKTAIYFQKKSYSNSIGRNVFRDILKRVDSLKGTQDRRTKWKGNT